MQGVVVSPETFEWLVILATTVLMCLVHPRHGSLVPVKCIWHAGLINIQLAPIGSAKQSSQQNLGV